MNAAYRVDKKIAINVLKCLRSLNLNH